MKVLVLSERDVHELLTMQECIAVMEDALAALARGEVHNPLRQIVRAPDAPGMKKVFPGVYVSGNLGEALQGLKGLEGLKGLRGLKGLEGDVRARLAQGDGSDP